MQDINKAYLALKEEALRTNKRQDVIDTINFLPSIAEALELPSMSQGSFQKLSFILRSRMLHLYRTKLTPALQYAAAVLVTISEVKIRKLTKPSDAKVKTSWENVQESLLSGVLDFLEQQQTDANRTEIASIFCPVLCHNFFPQQFESVVDVRASVLCTIFQLLSEVVICHSNNQHKLRDSKSLGGKRLGLLLAQCRDFLAIEALLELIGNLIPSTKNLERRTIFIQDVFSSSHFRCSAEVVKLLDRATSTSWDMTCTRICDALAKSDIRYPQPFETTQVRINAVCYVVSRIYVDESAFIASVDEGGQLETFKLLLASIREIKISTPSMFMVTVSVIATSSPLLGRSPVSLCGQDGMSIDFDLRKEALSYFLGVLRKRGLRNVNMLGHRKHSMAKTNVDLAFESRGDVNRPPLEEKIENLSRLWTSNVSPEDTGQVATTSPLHKLMQVGVYEGELRKPANADSPTARNKGRGIETLSEGLDIIQHFHSDHQQVQRSSEHDAIFGATDEELSDLPVDDIIEVTQPDSVEVTVDAETRCNVTKSNPISEKGGPMATRTLQRKRKDTRIHKTLQAERTHADGLMKRRSKTDKDTTAATSVRQQFKSELTAASSSSIVSSKTLQLSQPRRYGNKNIVSTPASDPKVTLLEASDKGAIPDVKPTSQISTPAAKKQVPEDTVLNYESAVSGDGEASKLAASASTLFDRSMTLLAFNDEVGQSPLDDGGRRSAQVTIN
ncbi:hypothetical protein AX17_004379 [Amanita inopinata Kibby_2008]|nr:hypothetical protein AX17_004379 [Amanita inopinata Kibby_2008]